MGRPLAFMPGISIVLLALQHLRQLFGRLDAKLQRRARRRAQDAAAVVDADPRALLGLWAASLKAARAHRHGQHD